MPVNWRGWCITINDKKGDKLELLTPVFVPKMMNYLAYVHQKVSCDHWQVYVQYKQNVRQLRVATDFPGGHVEVQKYEAKRNHHYIVDDEKKTNVGKPVIHGELDETVEGRLIAQGQRTDLMDLKKDILEGKSMFEIAEKFPSAIDRCKNLINVWRQQAEEKDWTELVYPYVTPWFTLTKPDPAIKKRHWLVVGAPDHGKTYQIQQMFEGKKVFMADETRYPFEGYQHEDIIIYDDVIPTLERLISISNTWKLKRSVGETRNFKVFWKKNHTRTIIMTLNVLPEYSNKPAFTARFNIVNLNKKRKIH